MSAIAFLTLPEVLKELHKRLPAMIIPKLPSKPKPPVCLARRKNRCPYKEELFKCSDWASYRNALQKWQKQYKLLQTIPKITLPCFKQQKFLVNDGLLSEIRKEKDIYFNHFEKSDTKDLQKGFSTKFDTKDAPKLPVNQKSWLDEKKAYYIRDASLQNEIVTEIIGVSNITPSNSDEKFFAMLKLDDRPNKIFPSGRENLSRNWQDWLQNVDEDFKQVEEKADELIKRTQTILKLVFPGLVCDNCCSCRQTRKFEELQQSKASIDNTMQNSEYVAESISMHSLDSTTKLPINLTGSQKEIETNFIISDVTEENGKKLYNKSGVQENISIPDPSVLQLKNVPPCSCAIQQMISKKVSPSLSKDDIPWTKDEGLCMGKKYRPDEARTYFCKKYPTDKSCRRNPFMKEIIRMERDKREEKIKEEEKGNAELIEVVEKEIQTSTKNMLEKKKNKFISDYFVYDNPWNMLHTAPSNITKTNYEKTLKLTPPALPMISLSEKSDVTATREDEHKKDIKYCIKGVATDVSMSSPELIIDGMVMLTPFQTLKLSKKGIPQVVAPHRHWSPINISLDPLQRRKEEMEHRKKASDKAFRFIYENNSEQDASYLNFSYQESDKEKLMTSYETKENDMDMEKKTSKRTAELQSPSKKHTDRKYMAIIKTELKKMAAEGYIFANLPKCYLMPQLRNWIMYRQSVTFSETDKKNLMQTTINTWQLLEMMKTPKLEQPSLSMTKRQLKRLTYNQAKEIKKKIQEARAIFHSKVRKARVSYAHNMWNTMEFGKFPSTSFKRTFFTYMASKEADGHVYKPWLPSEVYGAEPKFSYY